MNKIEKAREKIQAHIEDAIVETYDMVGDMDNLHLAIMVASNEFKGKVLIQQHQMIMDILKEDLKSEIHAVKIKTMTLDKYKEANQ
jgi:stress-induced morphogen